MYSSMCCLKKRHNKMKHNNNEISINKLHRIKKQHQPLQYLHYMCSKFSLIKYGFPSDFFVFKHLKCILIERENKRKRMKTMTVN